MKLVLKSQDLLPKLMSNRSFRKSRRVKVTMQVKIQSLRHTTQSKKTRANFVKIKKFKQFEHNTYSQIDQASIKLQLQTQSDDE